MPQYLLSLYGGQTLKFLEGARLIDSADRGLVEASPPVAWNTSYTPERRATIGATISMLLSLTTWYEIP